MNKNKGTFIYTSRFQCPEYPYCYFTFVLIWPQSMFMLTHSLLSYYPLSAVEFISIKPSLVLKMTLSNENG